MTSLNYRQPHGLRERETSHKHNVRIYHYTFVRLWKQLFVRFRYGYSSIGCQLLNRYLGSPVYIADVNPTHMHMLPPTQLLTSRYSYDQRERWVLSTGVSDSSA